MPEYYSWMAPCEVVVSGDHGQDLLIQFEDSLQKSIVLKYESNKSVLEFAKYKLVERMFIILPFMHSEDHKDCQKSVLLIE